MKTILALTVLMFSTHSMAAELPLKTKKIILSAIASDVFFEDEGAVRAPSKVSDFTFKKMKKNMILVTGDSYSDWDMKKIHYTCEVTVLNAKITTDEDLSVSCSLDGENWPYLD